MIEMKFASGGSSMGWLEWSASIIGSVAWPIAIIIVALLFRRQITALLRSIRKLSWGDATVDFSAELDKIERKTQDSPEATVVQAEPNSDAEVRFNRLLEISPAAAVLDAWLPIETRLRALGRQYQESSSYETQRGLGSGMSMQVRQVINMLGAKGYAKTSALKILGELQHLRNAAAHHGDVSVVDAIRFKTLAASALAALEGIAIN